jgi:hypothetical protein
MTDDLANDEDFKRWSMQADESIQRVVNLRLGEAERAWNEARVVEAVINAIEYCTQRSVPPPAWIARALREIVPADLRYARNLKHYRRYDEVVRAWQSGLTWDEAYEAASEKLQGTVSAGTPGTMRDDYKVIRDELQHGNPRRYFHRITDDHE